VLPNATEPISIPEAVSGDLAGKAAVTVLPPDWRQRPTLSIAEAGEVLGVSRDLAYRAAARGDLPTIRLGPKRLRVPTAQLLALLGVPG